VPEDATAQPKVKSVKAGQHQIQGLLQKQGIDQLCQRDADAVDIAHLFPGDHGKQVGGVVQLIPPDIPADLGAGRGFSTLGGTFSSHKTS
jgi:hypothetical protein